MKTVHLRDISTADTHIDPVMEAIKEINEVIKQLPFSDSLKIEGKNDSIFVNLRTKLQDIGLNVTVKQEADRCTMTIPSCSGFVYSLETSIGDLEPHLGKLVSTLQEIKNAKDEAKQHIVNSFKENNYSMRVPMYLFDSSAPHINTIIEDYMANVGLIFTVAGSMQKVRYFKSQEIALPDKIFNPGIRDDFSEELKRIHQKGIRLRQEISIVASEVDRAITNDLQSIIIDDELLPDTIKYFTEVGLAYEGNNLSWKGLRNQERVCGIGVIDDLILRITQKNAKVRRMDGSSSHSRDALVSPQIGSVTREEAVPSRRLSFVEKLTRSATCPKTGEFLTDNLETPNGNVYDMKYIDQYVRTNCRSPITGDAVELRDLKPNNYATQVAAIAKQAIAGCHDI